VSERCTADCVNECAWIFDRLQVFPRINGGSRIEWTLHPGFADPLPYDVMLQVGSTGLDNATDWTGVGFSARNTFYLVDDVQRVYGHTQWTHYRVRLETPVGVYYSDPISCWGNLDNRHWRLMREVTRKELLLLRKESGQEGYLLKRRISGTPCAACISYMTDEVTNAQCPECYGTGFEGGYYAPLGCVYANLTPSGRHEQLDRQQTRGSVNETVATARMLAAPQLSANDVWVDRDTDFRWNIHQVQNVVEMRGVPVVVQAGLRLCPFSDPVYKFPISGQLPVVEYY
jgi:hypothetical protein